VPVGGGSPIPLATDLPPGSDTSGTSHLNPGNYQINISSTSMGPGAYTVIFNLTASINISSPSPPFGSVLAGSSPHTSSCTISSTGDASVTISSLTSSDSHFQIISPPIGQTVPPNRTFQIRFNPGAMPGTFSADITVTGTSDIGPVTRLLSVTATTLPSEPNIVCSGSATSGAELGRADGDAMEHPIFTLSFQNTGHATLNITSITLASDILGVFELVGMPSTAPVAMEGGTRNVQIRFNPPPGEGIYRGHIRIESNNPGPPKECRFSAIGHHPVPRMRVESNLLDYHQVELGYTFTKAIVVFNDGDAPLIVNVSDNCGTDATCIANQAQWMSRETTPTSSPVTIPPRPPSGQSFRAFRMVYRPTSLSPPPHEIQMRVTGNDLANSSQDVTLRAEAVTPIPIDSVLVLDRSGSMRDLVGPHRKIEALKTAADLFVHLLRRETGAGTGDKVGFVRYNQENDAYLPLEFVEPTSTPGNHLADAEDKLSDDAINDTGRLGPSGTTGIGGAIQRAAGMLTASPPERKHVMVVLTDGEENEDPRIATVLDPIRTADPNIKMYSIGLGSLERHEVEPEKLQLITNVSQGYHQVTEDLSGTNQYELESFYFKIFTNAAGLMRVVDPTTPVLVSGLDPIVVNKARIVSSDHSVIFLVLDEPILRTFYRLEMVTPGGQVIDPGTTVGGITVHQQQRYNYTIYKIIFPDESLAANYIGDWVLRLVPNGTWSSAAVDQALLCSGTPTHAHTFTPLLVPPQQLKDQDTPCARLKRRPDAINPHQALVPVGFGAVVSSDYRMDVKVLPSIYLPGADVKLTVALSDRGLPTVVGDVFVDITTPNKTLHPNLRLFDDGTHGDVTAGDGTWTTHFTQTAENGSYKFFFHAIGANERGELAPREDTRYATLMFPKPPGRGANFFSREGKGLWYSFHLGYGFPRGSFKREYNSGPSLTFDLEYEVRSNLSLYGMLGYHYFRSKTAGIKGFSYTNLSLNLRAYFPVSSWRGYVQVGPGAYFPNSGSTKLGLNVGAGLDFPIQPKLSLELGVDLHYVDPSGVSRVFIDPKLGIKFRF
jgi:Mg-chelatase subunit ChlD